MTDQNKSQERDNTNEIVEFLFSDPFSTSTKKSATLLVILSSALLLSQWLDFKFSGIPLLGITVETNEKNTIQFLFWVSTLFVFLRYLPRVILDFSAQVERSNLVKGFFAKRELDQLEKEVKKVDEDAYGGGDFDEFISELDPWWEAFEKKKEELIPVLEKLRPLSGNKKWLGPFKFYWVFLEGFIPVIFALISLVTTFSFVLGFFEILSTPTAEN